MMKKPKFAIIAVLLVVIMSFQLTSCSISKEKVTVNTSSIKTNTESGNNMIKKIQLFPFTKEEYESVNPKSFTEEEYDENDLLLESAYCALLNAYLQEAVDLDAYQQELDSAQYRFPCANPSLYFKTGAYGRKNICIRSLPCIHRLTQEQKEVIVSAIQGNELEINEELLAIVAATWRDLIVVDFEGEQDFTQLEPYSIVYDVDVVGNNEAMNNALVFEIDYEIEYDEIGNIADDDYENKKFNYLTSFKQKMETQIGEKLECGVTVFLKMRG